MTARFAAALVVFGLIVIAVTRLAANSAASPTVVELFTSQSCSSCPPAEAYLGKLAARADIVALEFHVDYWNDLVHGLAGKWNDVHSSPAFTARQRGYAARLPGGVYTPQMVIDGRVQIVGSRVAEVEAALRAAREMPRLGVTLVALSAGKTELRLSGGDVPSAAVAELWLVRFTPRVETKIRGGENRGRTLVNHHIVTGMTLLGPAPLDGGSVILDTGSSVLDGDGCAIIAQERGWGAILGAALCPSPSGKAP